MQLKIPSNNEDFKAIQKAINPARMGRYHIAGEKSPENSMACYIWNTEICREFFIPLLFAEVSCRNCMNEVLTLRISKEWYLNVNFQNLLNERFRTELRDAIDSESAQHKDKLNSGHIVSALTFGFWEHLTVKRFERMIWVYGIHKTFKGAKAENSREELRALIETVRRWRNRIAHHRAVFDKEPAKKFTQALTLIKWSCPKTSAWIQENSNFDHVIQNPPQLKAANTA